MNQSGLDTLMFNQLPSPTPLPELFCVVHLPARFASAACQNRWWKVLAHQAGVHAPQMATKQFTQPHRSLVSQVLGAFEQTLARVREGGAES